MRFLFFLLAFMACSGARAADITFPELTGRVVDVADILDAGTRVRLEKELGDYERETSNQFVVVTLPSLQGQAIEEYGYKLGRHWQIGQKQRNNGALLIVVPNERRVRIEVGYGLEPVLTDAVTRLIIERAILPRFRTQDYAGGITTGLEAMMKAAAGEFQGLPQKPAAEGTMTSGGWLVFLLLLFWMMRRSGRGRYGSGLFWLPLILGSRGGYGGEQSDRFDGGGGGFGGGGASGRW